MTSEDQIRAERARQLLDDEVLVAALDAIEARHVDALKAAKLFDGDRLIEITAGLQAVQALRSELAAVVTRGTERPARRGVA